VELDKIDSSFFVIPPRVANLLLDVLCLFKPPQWLWKLLPRRVRASSEPQCLYPRLGVVLRTLYLSRRVLSHPKRMDFSITPGWAGYVLWRLGVIGFWWRRMTPRPPRPVAPERSLGATGATLTALPPAVAAAPSPRGEG
jgi:hypothetical protein